MTLGEIELIRLRERHGDANPGNLIVELCRWEAALCAAFSAYPQWATLYGDPDPDVARQGVEIGRTILSGDALLGMEWWESLGPLDRLLISHHRDQGRISGRISRALYAVIDSGEENGGAAVRGEM